MYIYKLHTPPHTHIYIKYIYIGVSSTGGIRWSLKPFQPRAHHGSVSTEELWVSSAHKGSRSFCFSLSQEFPRGSGWCSEGAGIVFGAFFKVCSLLNSFSPLAGAEFGAGTGPCPIPAATHGFTPSPAVLWPLCSNDRNSTRHLTWFKPLWRIFNQKKEKKKKSLQISETSAEVSPLGAHLNLTR